MTELENMLGGRPYVASDPDLVAMRRSARQLTTRYNATTEDEPRKRDEILRELFGRMGDGAFIEPPLRVDYGVHVRVGKNFYANFNLTILDCHWVDIGDQALLGPNVQLLAATHPLDPTERVKGPELSRPIRIGDRCWLGGGVIVCPGVTIGDGTTIGAGSVVARDIPAGVLAVGNPCRVVRTL